MSTKEMSVPMTHRVPFSRIVLAGLAVVAAVIAANLLVRALLFAVLPLPAEFPPFSPLQMSMITIMYEVVAVLVYALVLRFSKSPNRTYLIIAALALTLSLIPNLMLMANPSAMPLPGGTTLAYGALMIFHFVDAVITVWLLFVLTMKR